MTRSSHPHRESLAEDALRWFLCARAADCSAENRRNLDRWLAADPAHRDAYAEVEATWSHLDAVVRQPSPALQTRLRLAVQPEAATSARFGRRWGSPTGRWAAVAAMLVLVSGAAWWWMSFAVTVTGYQTARGEQRAVTLADGTIVELNTDTAVTVRLWGRGRQVVIDSGEAYFTVAHDPARPFEVIASNGQIHDIGTQFSVDKRTDRVVVSVETGAVEVGLTTEGASVSDWHVLNPGDRGMYTEAGLWSQLDRLEPHEIAEWRRGVLRFDGITLADAIGEVERYWSGKILLADAMLGETRIRGVFHTRNLDEFVTALPTILPVEVTRRSGNVIISRR